MKIQSLVLLVVMAHAFHSCSFKKPENKVVVKEKNNYIILLDLSDRLVVQEDQVARDKRIIGHLYSLFEKDVKENLYIKSRDEIKVVIAPQRGSHLDREEFENRLYVNMTKIDRIHRRTKEKERKEHFMANVDTLYQKAVFSKKPENYYGADIWKYFYEDLKVDYSQDSLTKNYLFILTDGYPIVGNDRNKLLEIKNDFPDLHIILMEAAPRDKDMEWDSIMSIWEDWFTKIGIKNYTLIKRGAISKEMEQIEKVLE